MLRSPQTEAEWAAYFELRWRILREPWGQPPGSERDEWEAVAEHVALWQEDRPVAVGRIHGLDAEEGWAQIRYMAVDPTQRGRGAGRQVLQALEDRARQRAWRHIRLNARSDVAGFYLQAGYADVGAGPTMFGSIRHRQMHKQLS